MSLSLIATVVLAACGGVSEDTTASDAAMQSSSIAQARITASAAAAATADTSTGLVVSNSPAVDPLFDSAFAAAGGQGANPSSSAASADALATINRATVREGLLLTAAAPASGGSALPTPAPSPPWLKIASEGETVALVGTKVVRYGAGSKWLQKVATGSLSCGNAGFGSDPNVGVFKECDVLLAAATAAPPPPPPPPGPTPAPAPSPAPAPAGKLWSDRATWGGTLPAAGAAIVIPAGQTIVLDIDTPPLGALRIDGTLVFADRALNLTAASINLAGTLKIGTVTQPFANKATITLTGVPTAVNDGVARGINVVGGTLALYGVTPSPVWTRLNEHAPAGATALTLADPVNWAAGSTIAVAPTDYFGVAETERLTVSSAAGVRLATTAGLSKYRWGKLQYVTAAGMSLTPDPAYIPPATPAPTVLDERAAVANLSRNIVIQGADDSAWQNSGFGVHVMVTGLASKVAIDGVEIRRAGQAGKLGRYPMHWNMLSYSAVGQMLGDATGHVLKNSAIWNSANRCVVLHGTNGVTVQNNICNDILGHAFYLPDGVERRNVFEGNLALKIRPPLPANQLQVNEFKDSYQSGPSGFMLTNPDNTVRGNLAGDANVGYWLSFPAKALGDSSAVPLLPNHLPLRIFENNTAHSNRSTGISLSFALTDSLGNSDQTKYVPTVDGSPDNGSNGVRFQLKGISSYKNNDGAFKNVVSLPDYLEWVTADNVGVHFSGAGNDGLIARSLVVGYSLNNLTPYPNPWTDEKPSAFATYHSTFSMRDNTVVSFPFVVGQPSGMFKTIDYYMIAADKGQFRNQNNRIIGANPGYRVLPPNMDGLPLNNRNWTYAGALWDPNGIWGPKSNWHVFDVPFLTVGGTCAQALPAGLNGASCDGQYYGVGDFQTDFDSSRFLFTSPIEAVRLNSAGSEIGRWTVGDGSVAPKFGGMRHFAARSGGVYTLRFPGKPLPKKFMMGIDNAFRASDSFVFAVSFDGSIPVTGYTVAGYKFQRDQIKNWQPGDPWYPAARFFKPAASLSEVTASGGDKMWQDTANNLVWIKVQGGLPYPNAANLVAGSDEDLYRTYSVELYPK